MSTVSYLIANLLEKMGSSDKDFRFMATNDLMAELQKDNIKLDDESERKIVRMVLKLLEDKNGEVQNLAVKCLGPLVNKVKDYQVEMVVDALCVNMISENDQLRDISSIGIKTVITDIPLTSKFLIANICKRIMGRLCSSLEKKPDPSVQLEVLDILADLMARFGPLLNSYHDMLAKVLVPQLTSDRQAIRKRTIVALSYLASSCETELHGVLINHMISVLEDATSPPVIITHIQCVAAMCRQAGHRFGLYIDRVVPSILKHNHNDDDELHENCLQAFEAFVQRCPKEITPFISPITAICLEYITYDPNYNYDDGDGDFVMDTDEQNGDDDDDDIDYSDDDDMSWKVRRSAAKCLEAIINTRKELLTDFYRTVSPSLIVRFKEREENVRSDILNAYIALLRQTKFVVNSYNMDSMEESETPLTLLQLQIPTIIKAVHVQLRGKSVKTRQDCLVLLREMMNVLPGALSDHVSTLLPGIQYCLSKRDKTTTSNMKIDTLSFLNALLSTHPAEVFYTHMDTVVPLVINAVGDNFYKIIAEALQVLQTLVKVIRPLDTATSFNFTPYAEPIYQCTLSRLQTSDIDQEVKEQAISCAAQILYNLGDYLHSNVEQCLPIFVDRLRNEITRLTTVKAMTLIASSPLRIDLKIIMHDSIPILSSFLRKNHRALKLSTLSLLDTLIHNYASFFEPAILQKVLLVEIPPLISDSDLHIAQLSLILLTSITRLQPVAITKDSGILAEVINLAKSPLLQGGALQSMLQFFETLAVANIQDLSYLDMLTLLIQTVTNSYKRDGTVGLHRQALHSLAKCVASLIVGRKTESYSLVIKFMEEIKVGTNDLQSIFPLLVIGEIGRYLDLSDVDNLKPIIIQCLSSSSEDVKSAASYSLGCIAMGNLQQFLPFIITEIQDHPKRQYLLFHSLKDIICWQSTTKEGVQVIEPFVPQIWQQLILHCECTEEGTRNVVSECLGKLTLINPHVLLPQLKDGLSSPSPLKRTTVLTAVKFTISDKPQAIDPLLKQMMTAFIDALKDPDTSVRQVALVAFNSAAHNKPSLIRDLLDSILPLLYAETAVKKELIREVEIGPFKHTVDDGLDIRKSAFECMYTLLDTCLDQLDIFTFLNYLEQGLKDHYDIKMLSYLMLIRLAQLTPNAVFQRLDALVEPLKATCSVKVKSNAVKQEFEKQDELKKSAIRAVLALSSLTDSDKNHNLSDLLATLKSQSDLNIIFESVKTDSHCGNQDQTMEIS